MKKNRTMIVVALAIVLTLSIGYALFSQTINITGAATAQGTFQFTPVCTIGIDDGIAATASAKAAEVSSIMSNWNTLMGKTGEYAWRGEIGGSSNNNCTVSGNTVSMATTLAYPGALQLFTVKFTNTGTVSGKVTTSVLPNGVNTGSGPTNGYLVAFYVNGTNIIPNNNTDLAAAIQTYASYEFAPNSVSYMIFAFGWPPEETTGCNGGSDCTRTYSLGVPFTQYNQ